MLDDVGYDQSKAVEAALGDVRRELAALGVATGTGAEQSSADIGSLV